MGRRFMSIEKRAELCELFPHHSDAALAQMYGLNVRQVQYIGFIEGLRKTPETVSASARRRSENQSATPLRNRVQEAIVAAGEAGLSRDGICNAISGSSPSSITTCLNKLTASQKVFRAGRAGRSRWFGTLEQAQSHMEQVTAAARPAKEAAVKVAPETPPARLAIQPHIPAGLQIKYGHSVPGPEARWQTNARPVFSSMPPGVYSDQPSSWVKAVTSKP